MSSSPLYAFRPPTQFTPRLWLSPQSSISLFAQDLSGWTPLCSFGPFHSLMFLEDNWLSKVQKREFMPPKCNRHWGVMLETNDTTTHPHPVTLRWSLSNQYCFYLFWRLCVHRQARWQQVSCLKFCMSSLSQTLWASTHWSSQIVLWANRRLNVSPVLYRWQINRTCPSLSEILVW